MPRRSSDSEDSYRSRSRRKTKKSRRRKSSSSSSSESSDRRSVERSKPRSYKRSRSRERSKHQKSSHSSRRHHKKSRSSSNSSERSRTKNKKHSSRGKERSRRSRSRSSRSKSRTRSYKSKRSRSVTPKKSKVKEQVQRKDWENESTSKKVPENDSIRDKLEAALKAAAEADAVLRQKGLLGELTEKKPVSEEMNLNQQLKRAQAIEDINCNSFSQQTFTSSRNWGKKSLQDPEAATVASESSEVQETSNGKDDSDWRTNAEKLVHPSWFDNQTERLNRWKKKLSEMRNGKLNGEGIFT